MQIRGKFNQSRTDNIFTGGVTGKQVRVIPGPLAPSLNKTSTNPAVYGEPFVKRHGLFCMTVAPRHGAVFKLRKPAGP
jgi:hypothetical protein